MNKLFLCAVFASGCFLSVCSADETLPVDKDVAALNAQLEDLKLKHNQLLDEFDTVMQIAKEDKLQLYRELAQSHMSARAWEQAAKAYEAVVTLDPQDAASHYQLGLIYARYIKDTQKALLHLKRCIALKPEDRMRKDAQYLAAMIED